MPVFLLGTRPRRLRPLLWGLTIGLMGVASMAGLLLPALDEGSTARWRPAWRRELPSCWRPAACSPGTSTSGRLRGAGVRRSLLVFGVLLVHSLPEGFAIGDGVRLRYRRASRCSCSSRSRSRTCPRARASRSRWRRRASAARSSSGRRCSPSAPQPVGAVIAYLAVEQITGLLPVSFAFAAGAMLALVLVELVPQALRPGGRLGASAGAPAARR